MQAGARSRTGAGILFRVLNDSNAQAYYGGVAAIRTSSTDGDPRACLLLDEAVLLEPDGHRYSRSFPPGT
jgi:hypothetical protein